MSEHADSTDVLHCDLCGRRVYLSRCHACHPVQAPDRDEFLAEWAALPAAERLEQQAENDRWLDLARRVG